MIFTGSVAECFAKEMGYTHKEFLDNLPAALKGTEFEMLNSTEIRIPVHEGHLMIVLGEPRKRNIASISLPFMQVTFKFSGVAEEERTRFYRQFQRSYQKGGG